MLKTLKTRILPKLKKVLPLIIAVFLAGAVFVPSMLPGALANNIWSIEAIKYVFDEDSPNQQLSRPPTHHPHGSIWVNRVDPLKPAVQAVPPQVEDVNEDDSGESSLDALVDGLTNYGEIQSLDVQAKGLFQQGQYAQAISIWQSIGQKAALAEAASEASSFGITSLAIQAYQALYALDPQRYALALSRAYETNDEDAQALAVLQDALQAYPGASQRESWQIKQGDLYRATADWTQADATYQAILDENPLASGAWIGLGWLAYQRDQDLPQAISNLETAIAIAPQSGNGYLAMANLRSQAGQKDLAVEWYRQALERERDKPNYHLAYAKALQADGQTAAALAEYQSMVTRFPNYASGYYHQAWAYHLAGQPQQAINAIETALAVNPIPNIAYYTRADRIYQSNQLPQKSQDLFKAGEKAFQEIIDSFPDFPESYLQMASFYEAFSQTDQALEAYQTALTLDPDNQSAQQGLERLAGDA